MTLLLEVVLLELRLIFYGRRFIGIDKLNKYLDLGIERKLELDSTDNLRDYCSKIRGFNEEHQLFEIIENYKNLNYDENIKYI